jgi:gluconate:H+ symporter, GntP family
MPPAIWNNRPVHPGSSAHPWYLMACVAGAVLLLLLLVARLRWHAALGLAITALALGAAAGMPLNQVPVSFTTGVGVMMGHIAIILAMGAILGQLLAASSSGSALVAHSSPTALPWLLLGLGLLVGLAVFFEVGLVLLMPLVVEAARRTNRPPILLGIPVMAGLSIMHGLVPPHPAAMLAATVYHADVGRTILWGLAVGIPASILAGPVLSTVLTRRWEKDPERFRLLEGRAAPALGAVALAEDSEATAIPATWRALVAILMPVMLICAGSWADSIAAPGSLSNQLLHLAGYPDVALLIAALAALALLGPYVRNPAWRGRGGLRKLVADSFAPISGVLVILSAAGGLSGVLRDSGAAQATVQLAMGAHIPPLVLAWLLAAVVRVSMGSATVAMAVAAGVLAPLAGPMGVRPEMLVLATGSGSLILSHVNDSGFWLVESLFRLEIKGTLATWSVLETILSLSGLGMTLALAALVR